INMKPRILALVFALSVGAASAEQTNIALPSQSVIGNALPVPSTANAIPLAQLQTLLNGLSSSPTAGVTTSGIPAVGYVPIATGMTTATWGPPLAISAKAFGAKGDGVTDDYQKIKDADTALASAGGGDLYFPART